MNIEATKIELMQLLLNTQKEHVLKQLREVFEKNTELLDQDIKQEMILRALKSEEDIKAGRVYTIEEAEDFLSKKMGF